MNHCKTSLCLYCIIYKLYLITIYYKASKTMKHLRTTKDVLL